MGWQSPEAANLPDYTDHDSSRHPDLDCPRFALGLMWLLVA